MYNPSRARLRFKAGSTDTSGLLEPAMLCTWLCDGFG